MRPIFDKNIPDIQLEQDFKNLFSRFDIAKLFQIPEKNLIYILYRNQDSYYKEFTIKKKSGGERKIFAPRSSLKIIQKRLNYVLQLQYKPKPPVHGFSLGKGVKTNAEGHIKRAEVFNIDLEDFFPNIHFGRVKGMFKSKPFNFPNEVAMVLAQICCYKKQLPAGAPTSPIISNLVCRKLDDELQKLAKNHNCLYTRYADDITFSSNTKLSKKIVEITPSETSKNKRLHAIAGESLIKILEENKFEINPDKVRLLKPYNRQEVTGLVVNEKVNVKRKYLKTVRTVLHNCEVLGIPEAGKIYFNQNETTKWGVATKPSLEKVLQGKLAYIKQIKGERDSTWRRLQNRFLRKFKGLKFDRYLVNNFKGIQSSLWIIQCGGTDEQGTGFLLNGYGLITCRHVVENNIKFKTEILAYKFDEPFFPYHATIVKEDKDGDIVELVLDQSGLINAPFYEICPSPSKHGDFLTVCGLPDFKNNKGARIQTSEYVQTKTVDKIERILVLDMQFGGMSGGPVLNNNGQVVGIIVTGIKTGQDLSKTFEFGINPISVVSRLK